MATFLLAWNPKNFKWPELAKDIEEVASVSRLIGNWSSGSRKHLPLGSRLFLIRLGRDPRGIIGSGWSISEPYEDEHWDEERATRGEMANYIEICFDFLGTHLRRDSFMTSMPEHNAAFPLPGLR